MDSASSSAGATSRTAGLADRLSRVRIEWLYLWIALVTGLGLVVVTPPFQVFDEPSHYFRAWSVAQGEFNPGQDGRVTLPANVARLPRNFHYVEVFQGKREYRSEQVGQVIWQPLASSTVEQLTTAAKYGPLGYVPQAAGVELARILTRSPLLGLYLGRLANLVCAVVLTFFAIRLIPFGKAVLAILALFPTTILLSASLSPDALALAGMTLLLALALWLSQRESVSGAQLIAFGAAAVLLLNIKPGYVAFALVVLLIRPGAVGSRRRYALFVLGTLVAVAACALALMQIGPTGYNARVFSSVSGSGDMSVDSGAQLGYMLEHPWGFAKVVWWTMADGVYYWSGQMVGSLGWANVQLYVPLIILFWLALVAAVGYSRPFALGAPRRVVLVLVAVAVLVSVTGALYLMATPVAWGRVEGLQGRYFTPAAAPLLLSVTGIAMKGSARLALCILAFMGVVGALALVTVVRFYY